ncbi:MAG: hypothetical protein FWG15_00110 [Propionibacteriaceae bacterium]|nr:hypothetical protein [Propionibacteriaceae bacterium]
MRLNAPTKIVFLISIAIMLVGLIIFIATASKHGGWTWVAYLITLAGALLLTASTILKGL